MSIPFQFGKNFQDQAIAYCFRNLAFAKKFLKYIPTSELPTSHKFLMNCIGKNIETEGKIPNALQVEDELKKIDPIHREAYRNVYQKLSSLIIADSEFLKKELTEYARKVHFFKTHLASEIKWNLGQFEEAYQVSSKGMGELFSISFRDDEIISVGDFWDYLKTHSNQEGNEKIPTGIPTLDHILSGGLAKGELSVILGNAKSGKSLALLHFAVVALATGRKTAYFVLEGTTEQAVARFLSRMSGIPFRKINNKELSLEEQAFLEILKKKYFGNLFLVPMNVGWAFTVRDIEQKLSELESIGIEVDLVVVDYADLLTDPINKKEKRHEQTSIYRDLKRLAMIRNVAIHTASQAVRRNKDMGPILHGEHISESVEKIRITDVLLTINQTYEERLNGIIRFHLDLYRSGEGDKTLYLLSDFSRMIFFSKKYGELNPTEYAWQKKRRGKK